MASPKMTAKRRKNLPKSKFVYPPGSRVGGKRGAYPIDTIGRARNALNRSRQSNTKGSYGTVARAVRRRWGNRVASVGPSRGTVSRPGYARRRRRRRQRRRTRR